MNYMLLVNVLEYLDRENLEKLSIVTRQFENVIRTEFPKHPFRVFAKLRISTDKNGEIRLGMYNKGVTFNITSSPTPEANIALFKGLIERNGPLYCTTCNYSLRAMLPFMGKSVRFRKTIIELNGTLINQQSITAMENFAHLWTGGTLKIELGYDEDIYFTSTKPVVPNCDLIFNAPGLLLWANHRYIFDASIKQAFSEAKVARAWKFIIVDEKHGNGKLIEFRDENLLTKEVLELRLTDYKMKEDMCTTLGILYCRDLWILERKLL
ncbi:hypothetical protein Ddc_18180 [Ditylenchus destructor]|nr:hypothetical protein Ddc_18180 [Ditylenchus destructor]